MFRRVQQIIEISEAKSLFRDSDDEEQDESVPSYNETELILEKWEAIRQKYAPDTDSFVKKNKFQAFKDTTKDSYENQERIEEKKQYNFYKNRGKLAIPELISMAQFRLSLYSIFNITDDLEMAGLKTQKLGNQLALVKESNDRANKEIVMLKDIIKK